MGVLLETVNNSIAIRSGMKFGLQKLVKFDSGNMGVKGLNVFRSGTFKDSMGIQRTWEASHLEQMVFNFKLLRDAGKFVDVPFREDHSGSITKVLGYFQDLRHEGGFLKADIEFTRPGAADLWEAGHFRGRSAEVGFYEDNDESLYWPVLLGTAFVDIGAVEGLYSQSRNQDPKMHFFQVMQDDDKEPAVGEDANNTTPAAPAAPAPATPAAPAAPAPAAPAATPPAETPAAPAAPATPAQPAQHAAAQTHSFKIAGQLTTDFGAVQRHIDTLEATQAETVTVGRTEFVNKLVSDNKLAATQLDGMTAHALSLSDEQFASWSKMYETAPASPLFANHGQTPAGGTPAPGTAQAAASDEIEVLEGIITNHKRAGMSQENIEKTASFQKLQTLRKTA